MKTKFFTLTFALFTQFILAQITGIWQGDLDIQGMKLPLIIDVKSEGAGYKAVSYSPKQSKDAIAVDQTLFANNQFSFRIEKLKAEYSGKMNGAEIQGNFSQNGHSMPLNLHKITEEEFKKAMRKEVQPLGNREIDTKKIDEYLNYIAENKQGIGSVSIFRHGKEIYRKDFGQNQTAAEYNEGTGYQIGSISKLFTAVMLMQQVEKGKLKVTDKLSKFYPDMPNASKITLENMMDHTSGYGDYVGGNPKWLMGKTVGNEEILKRIKKEGVTFQPGEKMEYSNAAYFMLSRILEKVGGKPFNVLLKENILDKAGLKNTYSVLDNPKNRFGAYEFIDDSWKPLADFNFRNVVGLGDMISTTTDLNIFINALFQGQFLKKETLQTMLPTKSPFGLGMMGIPFYNIKSYGHGGTTLGQHSMVAYNIEDDFSVSQIINGKRMPNNDVAIGLLSIIYNLEYEFPKFNNRELTSEDISKFSGEYTSPDIELGIKIFKRGQILAAQATGQDAFPLNPTGENEFSFAQAGIKMIFAKDGKTMVMQQGGKDFHYTKK